MCGIGGVYLKSGDRGRVESFLRSVNSNQRHRGPDGEGTYLSEDGKIGLAHRRLSIIDLSERASQPMSYKNYVLSYNGEVYNYLELRRELEEGGHKFETTSDTEVLLHLYGEYGKRMLDKLLGMFSFVIYDKEEKTFFIARDIIGEKPLIYHECDDGFFFASEPGSLIKSLGKAFEVDFQGLGYLFLRNMEHVPDPYTPFKGVLKLKPAHYLIVKDGRVAENARYWNPSFRKKGESPLRRFDGVLEESVRLTERSDVPVSVLLSGGVDSSTVTYFLSKGGRRIKTYTFGAGGDDEELKRARTVSKLFKTDYREHILDFRDFRILEKIIASWGEPITNPSFIYSYILYRKIASDGTKVCITGNGMDELLFGYDRGQTKRALLSKALSYASHLTGKAPVRLIKRELYRRASKKLERILTTPPNYEYTSEIDELSGLYDGVSFLELSYFIGLMLENQHAVTMVGDVSGMLHGIEARNPFLNRRLVELVFSLPVEYKVKLFDRRKDKFILKKVMEKRLPPEILYAGKMGFGFNVDVQGNMMRDVEYIRGLAKEAGLSRLLKEEYIKSAIENGGKDLVRVYAVSSWLKEYGRYLKL